MPSDEEKLPEKPAILSVVLYANDKEIFRTTDEVAWCAVFNRIISEKYNAK